MKENRKLTHKQGQDVDPEIFIPSPTFLIIPVRILLWPLTQNLAKKKFDEFKLP